MIFSEPLVASESGKRLFKLFQSQKEDQFHLNIVMLAISIQLERKLNLL